MFSATLVESLRSVPGHFRPYDKPLGIVGVRGYWGPSEVSPVCLLSH